MTDNPQWTNSKINWRSRIVKYGKIRADQVLAHPLNPRKHPIAQRQAVQASFDVLGQISPIMININNNYLVDGADRTWLALAQGDDTEIDAVWVDLSEKEHAIALTTFDWITQMATYDQDTLSDLLQSIDTNNEALQTLLDDLASQNNISLDDDEPLEDMGPQIDRADELREKWQTERGQLWLVQSKTGKGVHRLMCGDSTKAEDVERLMGGAKAGLVVTSPPYWVKREYENETGKDEILAHMAMVAESMASALDDRPHIAINTGISLANWHSDQPREIWPLFDWWADALRPFGFYLRNLRIWAKGGGFPNGLSPQQDVVHHGYEFLASFTKAKCRHQNKMGEGWAIAGLWDDINAETQMKDHSAPFPVEIPRRFIVLYTQADEIIFEPYSGSGTTMIAAEQTGRVCYAMEIAPEYVAVALQRLSDMGLTPRLDTSQTTPEIQF